MWIGADTAEEFAVEIVLHGLAVAPKIDATVGIRRLIGQLNFRNQARDCSER